MKKMLFTAVLLAGTTLGFAKDNAQNNEAVTVSNKTKTEVSTASNENTTTTTVTVIQNKTAEGAFSCTMSFITREYNNCGQYQGSSVESIELPSALCGDMDNGIMMFVSNMNNGLGGCF